MQFDVLFQELEHGAGMIQALLADVTPVEARIKPSPEAWSVLEVICHLVDEERRDFRQHLDRLLQPPERPCPLQEMATSPYNERDLTVALNEFLEERRRSLVWLRALPTPNWDTAYDLSFGPSDEKLRVSAGDMLSAWVAHDNLHMRQLVELRRARLLRLTEPYDVRYAGGW
jgi:hypothetical protein